MFTGDYFAGIAKPCFGDVVLRLEHDDSHLYRIIVV